MGDIDVQEQPRAQQKLIHVEGALDLALSEDFRSRMMAAIEPGAEIVVDLSDVTDIDSVGLSAIVAANRAVADCAGAHMRVVVPAEGTVRRMFELTLLHLTIDVQTTP